MKLIHSLSMLLLFSCARGKETNYTASTPANAVVKSFLGIPLQDSVDFIRWQLMIGEGHYRLKCNYGIAKANTNGFINGGTKIELVGECRKENNYYQFQNGSRILKAVELNADLLHLLDEGNNLLVGNGGWSYTINNTMPAGNDRLNPGAAPAILKDSVAFHGRTPCKVPGIIASGTQCYKLKWAIILYANSQQDQPGTYKIFSTAWRKEGSRTGSWKIITAKPGQIRYQLDDESGKPFLYLLKLDENILVFTDADSKLLVGDEDFSYTLNRKEKF